MYHQWHKKFCAKDFYKTYLRTASCWLIFHDRETCKKYINDVVVFIRKTSAVTVMSIVKNEKKPSIERKERVYEIRIKKK